jgi:hypothetical protein
VASKHHDLVNQTKKYKAELYDFFLDLRKWRTFRSRYRLEWQKSGLMKPVKRPSPSNEAYTRSRWNSRPQNCQVMGYILYVGITAMIPMPLACTNDMASIWRITRKQDGRPAVSFMLQNWAGDLFFNFVPLPNKAINLARIESSFINALMPRRTSAT